jgi:3-deoxy-D-manno-octulosonic-acid transferase
MLIYRVISIILYPFLELYLFYRTFKGKEDKHRLRERFGKSSIARPEGDLIWIHAVSVGEANSAITLIEELLDFYPDTSILLTTTTTTSAAIVAQKIAKFNGRVIHQFLPIDSYFCVQDFFAFWRMDMAIFVESEIWPNIAYEASRLDIPSFLVNARISKKSFAKWNFARKIGFNVFDYFSAIFVQMASDKELFTKLSDKQILFLGNLKSQGQVLAVDNQKLQELKSQISNRKIFLAASTHKGEEEIIIATHKELKKEFSNLLTIIALRHPNRVDEVRALIGEIKFAQRSKNETIADTTEIYLVDTLGELGIFYSLTNFTFLGGSLFEIGGHNPFEPINLNCAVISGRGVANFSNIYQQLEDANACLLVNNNDELFLVVRKLLNNEDLCKDLVDKAREVIQNSNNIAKDIINKMVEFND